MLQPNQFYKNVRETGFIYGHNVSFDTATPIVTKGWIENEISKVALLHTLHGIYALTTHNNTPEKFIAKAVAFYNEMNPQGFNLFKKITILPINSKMFVDVNQFTNEVKFDMIG